MAEKSKYNIEATGQNLVTDLPTSGETLEREIDSGSSKWMLSQTRHQLADDARIDSIKIKNEARLMSKESDRQ